MKKHNEKLKSKGLPYTAIEIVSKTHMKYQCDKGHTFEADRYRVLRGATSCPSCKLTGRLTPEAYELKLMEVEADFFPLEPYKGSLVKILHECINGHQHMIEPRRVINKTNGCPHCSGMVKKTTDSYKAELLAKGIEYEPVQDYVNIMTKIDHKCPECDHIWSVKPHDILNGSGCPVCAKMGFNRGRPAILYYARIWDSRHTYYKIGITNKSAKRRLQMTGKQFKILLERKYETGIAAEAAEQMILDEYKDCKIYAPQFLPRGGYTELFSSDVLLLDI